MQDKKNHREMLFEKQAANLQTNKILFALSCFCILALAQMGEESGTYLSRTFCFIFLILTNRQYNIDNSRAERPLLYYDAEVELRKAAQKNDIERLKECISVLGLAKINAFGPESGRSALHFAVRAGALEAVRFLVDKKADLNHQDNEGNTPVHEALIKLNASKKHYPILLTLISLNLDIVKGFLDHSNVRIQANEMIDPTLKNQNGKTIVDLFHGISPQEHLDYKKVASIMQSPCFSEAHKQELPDKATSCYR